MTTATARTKAPHSPRFLIVFVAVLLAVGALTFYGFYTFQIQSAAQRQERSGENLVTMRGAIFSFALAHNGQCPAALSEWLPRVPLDQRVNPAWPDEPGYVYLPGATPGDAPDNPVLIYENTPLRKRKLGSLALLLDGTIVRCTDAELTARLDNQKRLWKIKDRLWSPELILNTP